MELKPDGRYILISDIHGNYFALKKVVEDAISKYGKAIDGFIFLGDYACDFPWGNKVVELMMKLKEKYFFCAISGNREISMVHKFYDTTRDYYDANGHISLDLAEKLTGWSLETSMGAPLYDCCQMTKDQIEFLYSLPETEILENEREVILLKHKTPISPEEIKIIKNNNKKNFLILGHTHAAHDKTYDEIKHINPGAIALTDTGVQGAFYGVLERGKIILSMAEYDYDMVVSELRNNFILYDKCEQWGYLLEQSLLTGVNVPALYTSEKKRLIEAFKRLSEKEAQALIRLNYNQNIELARILLPILSIDEKPFSRNRYGNTNPYGEYIKIDVFTATDNGKVSIDSKKLITDDIDNNSKLTESILVGNNCNIPIQLINYLAREYVEEYLKYANQYVISKDRVC